MIEEIIIKNEASYDNLSGQRIADLKKINFFYGANGSGKTTISRVLENKSEFPDCSIKWKANDQLKTLVYNRDFVSRNFSADKKLEGIFTLGEDEGETIKEIERITEEKTTLIENIRNNKTTLLGADGTGGKLLELESLESNFSDICWEYKKKYEDVFKEAFKGDLTKEKFKKRFLSEAKKDNIELLSLEELKEKAKIVFADDLNLEEIIPTISYADLIAIENDKILSTKIIGKEDVDIAAMIKKLDNDDWIKQGRKFLDKNDGNCPFCQQKVREGFAKSLEEYFNESYNTDIDTIASLEINYHEYANSVSERISNLLNKKIKYLNFEKVKGYQDLLEAKIRTNKQHIARKKKEASTVITLESLQEVMTSIEKEVTETNKKSTLHNETIANLETEKKNLTSKIWRLISEEIGTIYHDYNTKKNGLETAITNLKDRIQNFEKQEAEKDIQIKKLESSITSIQPTINAINQLLRDFGFLNFLLDKSDKEGFYKLIRITGEDVKETLSEGEKTFITFLYFYHLIKGSNTTSGITQDRVIVFDDPVSSLDSDILFIVSGLIKGLLNEVRDNTGDIKQIIILTHNIYFHKEVSFKARQNESFFVVRKDNNDFSKIKPYATNPIKNSYELLWQEVKERETSSATIRNTLRRILEHYFKILGGIDLDKISETFEGKDKFICRVLLSWVHDGSHTSDEDLYVACDTETIEKYLEIFKSIFKVSRHIEHYNMMMGIEEIVQDNQPDRHKVAA